MNIKLTTNSPVASNRKNNFKHNKASSSHDDQTIDSYTSERSFISSYSSKNGPIPLPPTPHIPASLINRNQRLKTASSQNYNTATIHNQRDGQLEQEQQQEQSSDEGSLLLQYHEQLQQKEIVALPLPQEEAANVIDPEEIYRRSVNELSLSDSLAAFSTNIVAANDNCTASTTNSDTDDFSMTSIILSTNQGTSAQSSSRYNQQLQDVGEYDDDDDESWYDPDTMQRIREGRSIASSHHSHSQDRPCSVVPYLSTLFVVGAIFAFIILYKSPNDQSTLSSSSSETLKNDDNLTSIVLETAPFNLMEICNSRGADASAMSSGIVSMQGMPLTEELYDECEVACMTASCCVIPDYSSGYCGFGAASGDDDDNTEACLSYREPCAGIHPIFGMLTREAAAAMTIDSNDSTSSTKSNSTNAVENICHAESLDSPVGRSQCENVCRVAHCCFDGEVDCWQSHKIYLNIGIELCTTYLPCKVLYQDESIDNENGNNNNDDVVATISASGAHTLALTTSVLEGFCDPTKWKNYIVTDSDNDDLYQVCEDMCLPSRCCFLKFETSLSAAERSKMGDCRESQADLCEAYQSCQHLYNYTDIKDNDFEEEINVEPIESLTPISDNSYSTAPAVSMMTVLQSSIESVCSPSQNRTDWTSITIDNDHTSLLFVQNDNETTTCQDICYLSKCCFESSVDNNCWDDFTSLCDGFSLCSTGMLITESDDANAAAAAARADAHSASHVIFNIVNMACNNTAVPAIEQQVSPLSLSPSQQEAADKKNEINYRFELCEDLCLPYSCCFMEGQRDGCDDAITESLCSSYKACETFFWDAEFNNVANVWGGRGRQ